MGRPSIRLIAGTVATLCVLPFAQPAAAKVYPVGLLLKDAVAASNAFSLTQKVSGALTGAASSTCKSVSWMAARCTWSQRVTLANGTPQLCTGTDSVVRQQVKGYPLKVTRVSGTKISCGTPPA